MLGNTNDLCVGLVNICERTFDKIAVHRKSFFFIYIYKGLNT